MDVQFGQHVARTAQEMIAQGKDVNQTVKILFDRDAAGHNYGIGIILNGRGAPVKSSATLINYALEELQNCDVGTYYNSAARMEQLKEAVLRWQRIPEPYWPFFKLALPSDSGTGAVQSAVQLELLRNAAYQTIGIEELGWPAHKAIARLARVRWQEFPQDGVMPAGILPIYQSGPLNTTGLVPTAQLIQLRAETAATSGDHVVLDRAYSGFEFARLIDRESFDHIMRLSFELQIKPFLDAGVPMSIAISPTKAFLTFAFRPCGFLLVYTPDTSSEKEVTLALNSTIRARGSSFEHPITRAFVKAMIDDLPALEAEQADTFRRLAAAEGLWGELVTGTAIAELFSERYAGLFRNPLIKEGAPAAIYGSHLYPVFDQGRCRLNVTGLPEDRALAAEHVRVFAEYCIAAA
ncbi:aminotransferase class I/II-fold pyridoxal phosphate-dependent enzyme [candidate division KSB1 bacterium]|nr:aminotransferase class I/II-fold pyridoxal phosphate-dependent enzyme [candidate division KSB1 bacterium]RQW11484.1 MAG: aminotransferase class I/II-fold pyridoxal phosphate-dependent enzyme [candidate division KSB1 bacterium]